MYIYINSAVSVNICIKCYPIHFGQLRSFSENTVDKAAYLAVVLALHDYPVPEFSVNFSIGKLHRSENSHRLITASVPFFTASSSVPAKQNTHISQTGGKIIARLIAISSL